MSLKELKSTLKSCTSSSSLDYTTYSYPSSLRHQEEEEQEPKRKPPKTSIREQLKNLEKLAADLDDSLTNEIIPLNKSGIDPQINPPQNNENDTNKQGNFEEEGDANEGFREEGDSEAGVFVQPHTEGPFEPLVLGPCPNRSGLILQVPASINCRLLEHQREGVKFLYNLYKEKHGGVLGDDMGLGKTIQTIAFVAAVLQKDVEDDPLVTNTIDKSRQIFKDRILVLIICPTSVLQNWENEFNEWGTFNVAIYHGANKDLILEKLEQSGVEIILTSFDTYRIHGGNLCNVHWELVIVDEAHRLKNERSRLYKSFQSIKTKNFYGLTGTIMQNKIMDLFNVFDLLSPGCLGTREHFREYYDETLKQGQRISAPERFVKIAEERKTHLLKVLRRYLLRRTKEETIGHLMMGKEDNVVFCAMSPLQKRVYTRLLNSPDFKSLILKDSPCSCGSKLTRVECCHKNVTDGIIWSYLHRESPDGCDSCPFCLVLPCLVKLQQVSNHLELIKPNPKDDPEKQKKDEALAAAVFEKDADLVGGVVQDESFMGLSDAKHCGKMRALEKLMVSWISRGDKILLFSYSVRMLDILEKFLIRKGYCFSRLDGSTPMNNRQSLVDNFNQSPSKQVFLISTRAGGIGLNLVSANRVVIFDPNWNPAQDLQAQDRSFRYGQRRHVTVFRLLAAGSLEELVYTRQIYKQQLFNIAVSGNPEKRYFEGVQDSKEFKGELFGICNLFRDISDRLFTNEIVGHHKERLQNNANDHKSVGMNQGADKNMQGDRKRDCLNDPGMNELRENCREDSPILENLLTDAGVMYMHRNEEVVNYGSRKSDRPTMIEPCNDNTMASCIVEERKNSEQIQKAVDSNQLDLGNQPNKKQQKSKEKEKVKVKILDKQKKPRNVRFKSEKNKVNKQYNILAQFKGMTELQFSKWLLSASSSEIEKLLSEYRQSARKNKS